MKRYIYCLMLMVLFLTCTDIRQAKAYLVTAEKDGMYAEVIPDSFVNNAAPIFKKNVKKVMKYYNKYKDADDYTVATKVPTEYRDFFPVVEQIQASDKIIIRNPFYLYRAGDNTSGDAAYTYYFFAEKNGKKLCLFSLYVESDNGKISFRYDKMMDRYFTYDERTMKDAVFYELGETTYAETPDKINVVRNLEVSGTKEMIRVGGIDWEAIEEKFRAKNYTEKKDEIFDYLAKIKKGRVIKKSEKKLKQELKEEYIEAEYVESGTDTKGSGRTGIYIVIGIVIVVIGVIAGDMIFMKKRKKE